MAVPLLSRKESRGRGEEMEGGRRWGGDVLGPEMMC